METTVNRADPAVNPEPPPATPPERPARPRGACIPAPLPAGTCPWRRKNMTRPSQPSTRKFPG
jgi:hypothetical protein